jgi:hypothetical protein
MCGERLFRFHMPFFEFSGFGLGSGFPFRRFGNRRSYLRWLEAYKEELEEELKAVTEEIEELKKRTAEA